MRRRRATWPFKHTNTEYLGTTKRRPFTAWVKRLANLKGSEQQNANSKKNSSIPLTNSKHKKSNTLNGVVKNNPYPESGHLRQRSPRSSADGQLSFSTPVSRPQQDNESVGSFARSTNQESQTQSNSNKSAAPTLATNPETVHSDAGHSKALTSTTGGGAFSSTDGAGGGSTFSSPSESEHSLTTTLTTIQSAGPASVLQNGSSGHSQHQQANGHNVMFSHQYPVSPGPSIMTTASAIPRHISEAHNPTTYNSATAHNMLSDNASILTLASSSKRRRRSMDTDASVRALAPSSVWGGSRESLPLSVLSGGGHDGASTAGLYSASQSRPSIGGLASAERASVYSSQGVTAPALASERNSYYAGAQKKDIGDAKSLRSITNIDARSQYDSKSINDAKSMDVGSLRNYEGSVRSGALGHGRNDSIPGSIGSPLASPGLRHASTSGALSRRSSDWQELEKEDGEEGADTAGADVIEKQGDELKPTVALHQE